MAKKPAGKLSTLPEVAEWMRMIWPNSSDTNLSNVIQRLAADYFTAVGSGAGTEVRVTSQTE
jgi:uncharacterized protein YihD (DUF1040 family)